MPTEPREKRVVAFIDGQNLYHAARHQFGARLPDYDAHALAEAVCNQREGWKLAATRFYTGIHKIERNILWHLFWHKKFAVMERNPNVTIITRELSYVTERVSDPKALPYALEKPEKRIVALEKGIDLCLALDAIRLARLNAYDVALIFSRDNDFSEVAKEIRALSIEYDRWIKVASAFPQAAGEKLRGINQTEWIPITREQYSTCRDVRDYWSAAVREQPRILAELEAKRLASQGKAPTK